MQKLTLIYLGVLICIGLQAQTHADRIAVFDTFKIKGAGGSEFLELAVEHGANTIRTWNSNANGNTLALLDRAHALGLKVAVGFWMPGGSKDGSWSIDYQTYENKLQELLDSVDHHPAILCWELGNEVCSTLSNVEYMKAVNKLSQVIHAHNPNRLTSLVTNVGSEAVIQDFAKYCTDLDIIGKNGYGKSMLNYFARYDTHWPKPWYIAEYGTRGSWEAAKTSWGDVIDIAPSIKVEDIKFIHNGMVNYSSPKFVGAISFYWGIYRNLNYVWHSLILSEDLQIQHAQDGMKPLMTPMADEMVKYWSGSYPANRAPVISALKLSNSNAKELIINTGENFTLEATASDPDGDTITYQWWIYSYSTISEDGGRPMRGSVASGPFYSGSSRAVELTAPNNFASEKFLVYCVALDGNGGASAHTFPIKVTGTAEPPAVDPNNLIVDGNFEFGNLGIAWNNKGKLEEVDTYEGNFSARLSNASYVQVFDVEPGKIYNVSFTAKWLNENNGIKMGFKNASDNSSVYATKGTSATDWTTINEQFTMPDGITRLKMVLWIPQGQPACLLDNIVVRENKPAISISDDGEIISGLEDGEVIIVNLTDDSFVDNLTANNWTVTNLPEGVSVDSINRIDDSTAEIVLAGNATSNYDIIFNTTVTVAAAELTLSNTDLTVDNGVVFGSMATAIDEYIFDKITIYPNPASDVFTIQTTNEINNISIFDVSGKKILDLPDINSTMAVVNISELKHGFYLVKITNRMGNRITTRLIKAINQ